MENPFNHSSAGRVLNPCDDERDLDYYLDIDHQRDCLELLDRELDAINPIGSGAALLVHGKTGYGKSALANRIAHSFRARLLDRTPKIATLNFDSDIGQLGLALDAKVRTHFQLLSDCLRGSVLPTPEADALERRVDDPARFIAYLDERLRAHDAILILVFASLELDAELDKSVQLWHRRRIISILSTSSDAIAARAKQNFGSMSASPVLTLSLGPLRAEDGWTYVREMMSRNSASIPAVSRAVLDEYMRQRLPNSEVSVRELHRTCVAVFDAVIREGRSEVTLQDFAQFWMRVGK